ncbi:MAG: response regulator [Thiomargarita sp.]|nr:response regulator [Thiomargarita sp.]
MQLKIRTKLLLAFGFILILSSIVNIYSLFKMNDLAHLTTQIYNHPLTVTRSVLLANVNLIKMHRSMKDIIFAKNKEDVKTAYSLVSAYEQEVYKQFNIVQERILGEKGAALAQETIQTFKKWSPIRKKIISLIKLGKKEEAIRVAENKSAAHLKLLEEKMTALKIYAADKASDMYENAQNTRNHIIMMDLIILLIVIAVGILLSLFISIGISRAVLFINEIADKMVIGKITETVSDKHTINKVTANKDEIGDIGRAFYAVAISFKQVIDDIVAVSQGLAKADLRVLPKANYQGDFTQIREALEMALPAQRKIVEDIIQVSKGLSEGNLAVKPQVEYEGDFIPVKTTLEKTLLDLQQVITDIVQVSQGLALGEQRTMCAEYKGDFIQIREALEKAASKMAEATTLNQTQDWLKSGQTQLNEIMSGEQRTNQLAKNIITFLAPYLDIQVGIFYLLEENRSEQKAHLKLIASYAYIYRKGSHNEFLLGEGLVGQAALEKKPILITKVPDDYYVHIQSGLGKALPKNVILQPFMYEGVLKGVIELATFNPITDLQQKYLNQVMPNIGIAINSAESRYRVQYLLEQSRQQTEELQSQAEELQTQQEELTQTNEELEVRTKDLEQQKEDVRQKNIVLETNQAEMEKAKVAIEMKAKELELASKYKSEFLANMSHELRTPLNSLLILAQLFQENKSKNLTKKQVEYAKTIYSAGSDLLILINEILDLSKVEAGKIEVNLEEMVLSDLLEAIKQKFHHIAENKKVAFNIELAENVPAILKTDGQRLTQIINNLLSNAFKFTSEGEIRLTVTYATDASLSQTDNLSVMKLEANKTLAFSVSDSGIGIPEEKQQVIFEAFQQEDGSTSRRFGGTGLGLSISRQLARLLKGELTLESEKGKGSTFTLFLPIEELYIDKSPKIAKEMIQATAQPLLTQENHQKGVEKVEEKMLEPRSNSQADNDTTEQPVYKPKQSDDLIDDRKDLQPNDHSILIIEDDRKFSRILMELAREKGFKYLIAEDGKTGLQLAEEYHPTAIILDVGLPQIDGLTVMECLKDNPETRHIPVHFMSASDQNLDVRKMGAIGYLHKPINIHQLGEAFQRIEDFIFNKIKNLLLIVSQKARQEKILSFIENNDVKTTTAMTIEVVLQNLQENTYDCIIIDLDDFGEEFSRQVLEYLRKEQNLSQIPVIIYSEQDLTTSEEALLNKAANYIPLKSVKSLERLLDETTLFLHQVEAKLSEKKRDIIRMVHDKEAILKDKTVLVVDDDTRNTFALATALEDKEMEVIAATDGKKALALLDKHEEISIILMDIMMPEMDGYKTIQEIRKHIKHQKIPIIALTAKAMKGDRKKCIEAGANDYLSKPVDTHKLLSLMRVWLYR